MKRNAVVLLLVGLLAACVTINIYFPAAAAQEVADEIINEVWQIKEDEAAKSPEEKEPGSKDIESKGSAETDTAESK